MDPGREPAQSPAMLRRLHLLPLVVLLALPLATQAVQVCDLDGQAVNPSDGNSTAGKTGTMRCREGDGGPVVREQELQHGVFMGLARYCRGGALEREFHVNERGNHDGRSRTFAATPGATNAMLRDETFRDGTVVGLARSWHPQGALRSIGFHADDGHEEAGAEFTREGRLADLHCASKPLLGPDADGGVDRSYSAAGVKLHETKWVAVPGESRPRRIIVLDQEFHDSGSLVREQRRKAFEGTWLADSRGNDARPLDVHKTYDSEGRLRAERHHDARGHIAREREFDEAGRTIRDDEVFEDGSRKAFSR